MTRLVHHLAAYAAYHRNPRNIATHMIGIPLIVFAVEVLLSRPMLEAGGATLTPAMLASALATLYYLRLDLMFGLLMGVLLALLAWLGTIIAAGSGATWLGVGLGSFAAGWALQFAGHGFEGRKPAFLDDVRGLIVGPLFIVAETVFAAGGRRAIRDAVARQTSGNARGT